jgi:hypothetical protein
MFRYMGGNLRFSCFLNQGEEAGKTVTPEAKVRSADQIFLGLQCIVMQKVIEIFIRRRKGGHIVAFSRGCDAKLPRRYNHNKLERMLLEELDGFFEHLYLFRGGLWIHEIFQELFRIFAFQYRPWLYGMSHLQNLCPIPYSKLLRLCRAEGIYSRANKEYYYGN